MTCEPNLPTRGRSRLLYWSASERDRRLSGRVPGRPVYSADRQDRLRAPRHQDRLAVGRRDERILRRQLRRRMGGTILRWQPLFMRPDYSVQDQHEQIRRTILSSVAAFRSVQNFLSRVHVDRLYVFNGRFATMRAVMRAAESRAFRFSSTSAGAASKFCALRESSAPMIIDSSRTRFWKAWDRADPELRELIGAASSPIAWRVLKATGIPSPSKQEVGKAARNLEGRRQEHRLLPPQLRRHRLPARDGAGQTLYDNQYEGIDRSLRRRAHIPS